jgi:hypothetical protein
MRLEIEVASGRLYDPARRRLDQQVGGGQMAVGQRKRVGLIARYPGRERMAELMKEISQCVGEPGQLDKIRPKHDCRST